VTTESLLIAGTTPKAAPAKKAAAKATKKAPTKKVAKSKATLLSCIRN